MKKITFGKKGWTVFAASRSPEENIPQALKIRGYRDVTIEDAPDANVWGESEQIVSVTGSFSGVDKPYLLYLTSDREADERVREALSFLYPEAALNLTSTLMDRPE